MEEDCDSEDRNTRPHENDPGSIHAFAAPRTYRLGVRLPILLSWSKYSVKSLLGPDFDSLTRVHFALYSCTVAAFATPAASICTVTPETVVFRGDRKAVIFKDDREAVDCPCRAGSRSGLGWPQSLPVLR